MSEQQPVVLVPSRYSEWVAMPAEMAVRIRRQVPDAQVEHIGSTSVPDLPAKDVVDLLVGVRRVVFRDLLRHDPQARARYLAAKQSAAGSAGGWDDYTQSKTPVVAELLAGLAD
ncbi:GrpB family protein [Arthrobacter sp. zg-Y1143]|uniref:GrpB family protein n=1 Tax=Arthrobacter sp. zg-Y1143 TaxID=3049065 RepID=UPI0024C2DF74|nr:GrpB family protein [Arthrobacter sp. zg-Y1143]MDK1329015.1 GrpB family protein [Arthrobacter sp. zg-Y1143]